MDWRDKKVLIVGLARSGIAAAQFLARQGAEVTVSDQKQLAELKDSLRQLDGTGVRAVTGGYPDIDLASFDVVVTSPGVAADSPVLTAAQDRGVPVWSELELAARFLKGEMIAVTGTNGKTTTTALLGRIFNDAGRSTIVAGNIGLPLIREAERTNEDSVTAVEVSSFQLEWVEEFHPRVAVLLNLSPDHLDRHRTMENYAQTKARIFARQGAGDFTVINYNDKHLRPLADRTRGQVIFFSSQHTLERGVFLDKGQVVAVLGSGLQKIIAAREIAIPGPHNLENALAATAAALVLGIRPESIAFTLKTFTGVRHRLEKVGEVGGITYINDSKGTNPDAAMKALQSFEQPVVLIAGGRNKGNSFDEFAALIKEKVKGLLLLGEAAPELKEAVRRVGFDNYVLWSGFDGVVARAAAMAGPGDIVLLSPACASWDMFNNYEERGDEFRRQVEQLALHGASATCSVIEKMDL